MWRGDDDPSKRCGRWGIRTKGSAMNLKCIQSGKSIPSLAVELLCWAFCLLLMGADSTAQLKNINQYVHNSWGTQDGLPENSVWSIAQSSDGYLWFGTEEGLVRYDGTQFTVFNSSNSSVIKYNAVLSLTSDGRQGVWIGSRDQLLHYRDGKVRTDVCSDGLRNARINSLLQDHAGALWIATDSGLYSCGQKMVHYGMSDGLSSDQITTLAEHPNGDLWVGTSLGLNVVHRQGHISSMDSFFPRASVSAIQVDVEGGVWVATLPHDLYHYSNGKFLHYGREQGIPQFQISAILLSR